MVLRFDFYESRHVVVSQASFEFYVEVVPIEAVMDDSHQVVNQFSGVGAYVRFHEHFNHDFVRYLFARFAFIEDVRERFDRLKYFQLSVRDRAWSTYNFVGWSLLYLYWR